MHTTGRIIKVATVLLAVAALALLTKAQYPAQVIAFGNGTPYPGYNTLKSYMKNVAGQLADWLNGDPHHGIAIKVKVPQTPWILTSIGIYGSERDFRLSYDCPVNSYFKLEIWDGNGWTLYSATYDARNLFPLGDSGGWSTITLDGLLINTTTFYVVIYPNVSKYETSLMSYKFCGFQPFIYPNSSGVIYLVSGPGNGIISSISGAYPAVIVSGVPASTYFGRPIQPVYVGGLYNAIQTLSNNVTALNDKVNSLSSDVNSLGKEVSSLKNTRLLNTSVAALNNTLNSQISSLNSKIDSLSSEIQTLNFRISSLNNEINSLKNAINSLNLWINVLLLLSLVALIISIVALARRGSR